jgi:pyruvate formate lyase activating enzyme
MHKELTSNKSLSKKSIYSITPFSILDYPDKTACILWFAGCNMRCSYCYNPEIVFGKARLSIEEIKSFLLKRIGLLDAVVMSGGECLMYPDLTNIIHEIKTLGFLVKIDTNGSSPNMLKNLLDHQLIDFVSLDFKALQEKTKLITKVDFYDEFISSCTTLLSSGIQFEVRTTYHSDLLNQVDLSEMITVLDNLGYKGKFFIQAFKNGVETLEKMNISYVNFNVNQFSSSNIEVLAR